jgi:hypothetical protein
LVIFDCLREAPTLQHVTIPVRDQMHRARVVAHRVASMASSAAAARAAAGKPRITFVTGNKKKLEVRI